MSTRQIVLGLIVVAGAGLRLWGIRFGLPHDFARPDEEHITDAAMGILHGDLDPHFFLYPSLFIYVTAATYGLLFGAARAAVDPSSLHLVARVLAAVAGAATIALLYRAASELFTRRAALAAAAFFAVAFLNVRDSHFGVTDVPVTLLIVAAFWAAAICATRGVTLSRVAAAGLLSGLAASTKYNAAIVAVPVFVAIVTDPRLGARALALRAWIAAAVLAACAGAGFLVGTPFALLDRRAFLADFDIQRRTALGQIHSVILDAARRLTGERGWIHHVTFSLRYGLGIPLLVAAVAGACWLVVERPRIGVVVAAFPVVFYAAMGVSTLAYARWVVPLVPFLCLTAAVFVDRVGDLAGTLVRPRQAGGIAVVALVVLIAAPTAAQSIAFDRLIARTDTRVLGARWIDERFPSGATLYQTGRPYGYLEPEPANRYSAYAFDAQAAHFEAPAREPQAPNLNQLPDIVVVLSSPLVIFSEVPRALQPILDARYDLAATFTGIEATPDAVYEQADAFYVPFAGFDGIKRPGPTVRIFRRRT